MLGSSMKQGRSQPEPFERGVTTVSRQAQCGRNEDTCEPCDEDDVPPCRLAPVECVRKLLPDEVGGLMQRRLEEHSGESHRNAEEGGEDERAEVRPRPLVHEVTYAFIGMTLGLTAQRKPRLPVEESGVLLDVRKVFQAGAGFLVLLVHAPGDEQQDCTQDRERGSESDLEPDAVEEQGRQHGGDEEECGGSAELQCIAHGQRVYDPAPTAQNRSRVGMRPRVRWRPMAVGAVRIVYVGHSTVLVEMEGVRLLTDPLLRSRLLHLRRADDVARPLLDELDAVLVSHLHFDHLDLPSLRLLGRDVRVVAPRGAGDLLARKGFSSVTEIDVGEELQLGPLAIRALRRITIPAGCHSVGEWSRSGT